MRSSLKGLRSSSLRPAGCPGEHSITGKKGLRNRFSSAYDMLAMQMFGFLHAMQAEVPGYSCHDGISTWQALTTRNETFFARVISIAAIFVLFAFSFV